MFSEVLLLVCYVNWVWWSFCLQSEALYQEYLKSLLDMVKGNSVFSMKYNEEDNYI